MGYVIESAWLYSGYAALVIAIAVIVWALFFDVTRQRIRRPRRCPKCWYDLSHTEGLRCNECGYIARKERQLHKSRKRWRWALLAIIPLIAADQLPRVPAIKERGAIAAVPTSVLAASLLFIEPDHEWHEVLYYSSPTSPITPEWHGAILFELHRERLASHLEVGWFAEQSLCFVAWWNDAVLYGERELWPSLSDMVTATTRWAPSEYEDFVNEQHDWRRELDEPIDVTVSTRAVWTTGSNVYAKIDFEATGLLQWIDMTGAPIDASGVAWKRSKESRGAMCGNGLPTPLWDDGLSRIGRAAPGVDQLSFDCTARSLQTVHFLFARRWCDRPVAPTRMDVKFEQTSRPILKPVSDPRVAERVRNAFHPSIHKESRWNGTRLEEQVLLNLNFGRNALLEFLIKTDATLGLAVEVLAGDTIIGTTEAWYRPETVYDNRIELVPYTSYLRVDWAEGAIALLASGEEIRIRVRGDHNVALRDFDATKYWEGEFEAVASVANNVVASAD